LVLKKLQQAPDIIVRSGMTPRQKRDLLNRIHRHAHTQSSMRRHKVVAQQWDDLLQKDF
jgi:hypothetical protein